MALKLAVAEYGEGPPVLVLHGLLGSRRNWTSFAQKLGVSNRVFALDLRNHGASPWADTMTYGEMAEDVRAFVKARALGSVAVIGHSMGGKTAMVLALQSGGLVDRLMVVDIAPAAYPPTHLAYVRALRAVDLSRITRRSDADAQLASAVPDAADRAFLLQNLVIEGGRANWRPNLAVLERALDDIAGFPGLPPESIYPGPVLFVSGGRSDYIRSEHEPTIRRLFPHVRMTQVVDAGHWVHAERPGDFLQVVETFLAGPDTTSAP